MIKLANELKQVKSVAIAGHVRPDGDCTGSCLAVYGYIREHFPDVDADVYLETVNPAFDCLRGIEDIKTDYFADRQYDLFLSLDVSDKERLGVESQTLRSSESTGITGRTGSNQIY